MSSQENARPEPPEGSCNYYVTRKKRYCRFKPSHGLLYCAEHAGLMGADLARKRVQCPYEPKHTCYADKLNHHMKKCPSRPREMPPFYSLSVNSGDDGAEVVPDPKVTVLTVAEEELSSIIDKVNKLYNEYIGDIEEQILTHECLKGELKNPSYGTAARRHRQQQASLIGHMDNLKLLRDGMCYLEMGAGKGQLSHWLHEAVEKYTDTVFVLIDRSHVRNKMDNLHKEEEVMERIRIDIEHLRLDKVPTIQNHDKPVVAFGKHLCGPATDLSLRCVCETLNIEETKEEEDGTKRKRLKSTSRDLAGAVIALCCHHRCTWKPYVGKKFFQSCGLSARDFQVLSSMSSWATCAWKGWSAEKKRDSRSSGQVNGQTNDGVSPESGSGNDGINLGQSKSSELESAGKETNFDNAKDDLNKGEHSDLIVKGNAMDKEENKKAEDENEGIEEEHGHVEQNFSSSINRQFTQAERETIGRKCKRLIDYGRVQYLLDHGLHSCLKVYIEEFYTPENVVLLAAKQ